MLLLVLFLFRWGKPDVTSHSTGETHTLKTLAPLFGTKNRLKRSAKNVCTKCAFFSVLKHGRSLRGERGHLTLVHIGTNVVTSRLI